MRKKYKVKDVKSTRYNTEFHYERVNGELTLTKKWLENGVEKCKLEATDGWEFIIDADNLEAIENKSNKNKKK
ncbi:MAG: hypothetical protein Unbinned6316contig1000_27 [Prokaryotic dsDNA virus sp.]|nr:MAG: hypothetical protein Unbinned6316contig1000_27 [Prokaryotic dsDNA virus sp.]|tara:strand:- start:2125 stop:2343 length:219 start_codon:yes stop_codon:yes gene_type:complete